MEILPIKDLGRIRGFSIDGTEYLVEEIVQNHNIKESVKLILKTAIDQRTRLIPLLSNDYPNKEISQKEFDRVCIIIDYLRPMWHNNTGKHFQDEE